ncbi:MAG: prolyl oligopeptidase family serine peptidase [Gemmatimonadaceae bacterium]|jgi:dipeptidyl-peptidase-4|nr:prolyl oligopeptidase family serine peptidase [Gemmatimonadaceae bacterium]
MPRVFSRHLLVAVVLACRPIDAQPAPLTLDDVIAGTPFTGLAPSRPAWSPDGARLAFLWNDAQRPIRDLWLVDRDGGALRRLRAATDTGASRARVTEFVWRADGQALFALMGGALHEIDVATGTATPRATLGADASTLALSPDGRTLSYLADGDLWVVPVTGAAPRRLTSVARPFGGLVPLGTYARRDLEIGSATWAGDGPVTAWSPDSRTIAVHLVDRTGVTRFAMPYYLGDSAALNTVRRGAPGGVNESRRVALVDVARGTMTPVDLPAPTEVAILDFEWSPRGALLIDRMSDDAIDRWLHVLDAPTASPRELLHDRRASRIYTDAASAWHPDGRRVLYTSDREDRYRLFVLDPATRASRALTPAGSDILGAPEVVPRARTILYGTNASGAAERQLHRIGAEGGTPVPLTRRPGTHTGIPSPDGTRIAVLHTDDVTPSELWIVDATGGTERRVTRSPSAAFAARRWVAPRYLTVPHRTDSTIRLAVRVYEPPQLDRTRRHPVLFGPVYSNTVRNRWGGQYGLLQQLLVQQGYIVVQVDVRGSTGYGRAFREAFLMDWGGGDLTDLESVVEHVATWRTIDRARMGIWGSSYGGTLTVYAMLRKPGLFAAGVAGAPAVDPRWFGSDDVAIARRPQSHPETFVRGKVLPDARGLRDPLLIIHGMADDVVPFQTSVVLFEELLRLGRPVDFAFAPAATHGWAGRPDYARYLLGRLTAHFDRVLRP